MNKLQRYLGRIPLHSTFGATLLTMAATIPVIGFFIDGTHPSPAATVGARVEPLDRYAGNRGDSTPRVAPKYVARLIRTCDCSWAKNAEALRDGTPLRVGQTLDMAAGLAEIAFASGAKVILQGPGVLEIESAKTAVLHSGKLTADVPDDLEGFKIRTAVVEVVALPADRKAAKGKSVAKQSAAKPDS